MMDAALASPSDEVTAPDLVSRVATLAQITHRSSEGTAPSEVHGPKRKCFIADLNPSAEGFHSSALLEHFAKSQPSVVALAAADGKSRNGTPLFRQRTFEELAERVDAYAHAFVHAGLKPGERAGVFITDGIAFVTVCYALQKAGIVPVLIDPGMGVKNMLVCVAEQELACFVGVKKAHVLRKTFRKAFASVRIPVLIGGSWFFDARPIERMVADVGPDVAKPFQAAPTSKESPATIVYTSGSTGVPKGVVYTHEMMGAQVNGVGEVGGFIPGQAHVACFPGFALYAVLCGLPTVFPQMDFTKPAQANPLRVLEAMDHFNATTAFASPGLWETFSHHVEAHEVELPRMRAFFASGAPVQPALIKRLLPAVPNGNIFTPYGATEALPVAFIGGREILDDTAAKTAQGQGICVGLIATGTKVRIIGITDDALETMESANLLPLGDVGEIVVQGPQVTRLYDQRPAHTAKAKIIEVDATGESRIWHRMGDIGCLSDDGRLWFYGRKTHRVQTDHGLLFSVPCESIFEQHESVFRAALTWRGEAPFQVPVMCIELRSGVSQSRALLEELRTLGQSSSITRSIQHLLFHPGFPVDRRHNAKIERESLSAWAERRL